MGTVHRVARTAATRRLWHIAVPVAIPMIAAFTALVLPLAVIAGLAGVQATAAGPKSCSIGGTTATVAGVQLDAVQMGRAQTITDAAASAGLDSYAATVALATAQQESRIRLLANDGSDPRLSSDQAAVTAESLNYQHDGLGTDHDSVNTFQQRWIAGWGTIAQLMDPVYAARAFYDRLVTVPDWQTIPLAEAAQAVQVSAYPDAYAQWESLATELTAMLWPAARAAADHAADPAAPSLGVCPGLAVASGSWIRPTDGKITSGFGIRWGANHAGVDIAGPRDVPVYAAADGTVTRADCTSSYCDRDGGLDVAGYGNLVDIDHGAGQATRYGHLTSFTVRAGQAVTAGALIGYQGATGNSTGVHLHFETHLNGTPVDPMVFMADRGVDLTVPSAG